MTQELPPNLESAEFSFVPPTFGADSSEALMVANQTFISEVVLVPAADGNPSLQSAFILDEAIREPTNRTIR